VHGTIVALLWNAHGWPLAALAFVALGLVNFDTAKSTNESE
jgi:hypothetical protein